MDVVQLDDAIEYPDILFGHSVRDILIAKKIEMEAGIADIINQKQKK